MNTGAVSVRYAKALLEYAVEKGVEDRVYAEMQVLSDRLRSISKVTELINNPTVGRADKASLLHTAVSDSPGNLTQVTRDFINMVVNSSREEFLLFMAQSYILQYKKSKGITTVYLTSVIPMDESRKNQIREIVDRVVSESTVEWVEKVDPSIIGGFILQIDGYRLDACTASQIRKIRKELIEKNNRII